MADKQYALIIDYKWCTNCHACEVAGKYELELPEDEWCIKVNEIGPAKWGEDWQWDFMPVPSIRCDLCSERIASGKRPTCVQHCEAQCLEYVPLEDAPARMLELGARTSVFVPTLQ